MKTNLLFLILFFSINSFFVQSQVVFEFVDFNTYNSEMDNDLINNFYVSEYSDGFLLTQIDSGGISGGSLTTPNIQSGQDNVIYCSKFKSVIGETSKTSISFKYNSALINPNALFSAVKIGLYGVTNMYAVIGSDGYLCVHCSAWNSWNDFNGYLNLVDGHWYKLLLATTIIGGAFEDQIQITCEVFDLGINGLETPTLINSIVKDDYYDFTFAQDTALSVEFFGTRWGGSELLDNFTFEGVKSADSCNSNNGFNEIKLVSSFDIFPNPAQYYFNIKANDGFNNTYYSITDLYGRIIVKHKILEETTKISTCNMLPGVYFINIEGSRKEIFKFMIIK